MKSDELFRQCGYNLTDDEHNILFEKVTTRFIYQIIFIVNMQSVNVTRWDREQFEYVPGFSLDKNLVKAIDSKIDELGWSN